MSLTRTFLSTGRANPRPNGALWLIGRLDDDAGGTLEGELLNGGIRLRATDADGSFDVTVDATHCRQRHRDSIKCEQRGDLRYRAVFQRSTTDPDIWTWRLYARGFSDAATGSPGETSNPLAGPVHVIIHYGAISAETTANSCRQIAYSSLLCR